MSLLLAPVALICPIFSGSLSDVSQPQKLENNNTYEQAICRIVKSEQGETCVSVGMHSVLIYPIHYVEADQSYITFSLQSLNQFKPTDIQLWTGDLQKHTQSSERIQLHLSDARFHLPLIRLSDRLDLEKDNLCISFTDVYGMHTAAQIQLEVT